MTSARTNASPFPVAALCPGDHPLGGALVLGATRFPFATWRNCSPSGVWPWITPPSGARVQRYGPELEQRLRPYRRPTNDSWRVEETYVRVKGRWVYLYRAVDSSGATLGLPALRQARCGCRQALPGAGAARRQPSGASGHQHGPTRRLPTCHPRAQGGGAAARRLWAPSGEVPPTTSPGQDHRAIKRRVKASGHFRAFGSAAATLAGYEAMHCLRKGRVAMVMARDVRSQNRFIGALFGVAA